MALWPLMLSLTQICLNNATDKELIVFPSRVAYICMYRWGCDAVMINTDAAHGGSIDDLVSTAKALACGKKQDKLEGMPIIAKVLNMTRNTIHCLPLTTCATR